MWVAPGVVHSCGGAPGEVHFSHNIRVTDILSLFGDWLSKFAVFDLGATRWLALSVIFADTIERGGWLEFLGFFMTTG